MHKILTLVLLVTSITSTIAEDVEDAHEDYFVLFLEDVLEACGSFLSDL